MLQDKVHYQGAKRHAFPLTENLVVSGNMIVFTKHSLSKCIQVHGPTSFDAYTNRVTPTHSCRTVAAR